MQAHSKCLIVRSSFAMPEEPPPKSKKDAINQASTAVEALMNRVGKAARGKKAKKQRNEVVSKKANILVPLMDDSPQQLAQLTEGILSKVANSLDTLVFLGDAAAASAFQGGPNSEVRSLDAVSSMESIPIDTQLVVFVGAKQEQIEKIRTVTNKSASLTNVIINAEWDPEGLKGSDKQFVNSFEIVYWHLPLAIQGLMQNTEGAVFRYVTEGTANDSPWCIYWNGEVISSQKERPGPAQLEQILYNKAAEDSKLVQAARGFGNVKDKLFGGFGKKQ